MKQFTLTKEEFITRSMAGEVFMSVETSMRFYYDSSKTIPFRIENSPIELAWKRFDGKNLFTLEQPKPRIERRWKWRHDYKGYTNESSYYMSDEYAKKECYETLGWYKAKDCFIDVELRD